MIEKLYHQAVGDYTFAWGVAVICKKFFPWVHLRRC